MALGVLARPWPDDGALCQRALRPGFAGASSGMATSLTRYDRLRRAFNHPNARRH